MSVLKKIGRTLIALLAAPILFAVATLTQPAVFAQQTGPIPNSTNAGSFGSTLNSNGGHVSFGGGPPPSINAACGTAPSIVSGTDSAFNFTSGTTTNSGCTITPATPWKTRPTCSVDAQVSSQAGFSVSPSGVINLSGVADSTTYNIICIGQPGG